MVQYGSHGNTRYSGQQSLVSLLRAFLLLLLALWASTAIALDTWADGGQEKTVSFNFNPQIILGPAVDNPQLNYSFRVKIRALDMFPSTAGVGIGLLQDPPENMIHNIGSRANEWAYLSERGEKHYGGLEEALGSAYGVGDTVRVDYDARARTLNWFLMKAGETEFSKQGTGNTFENVTNVAAKTLRLGVSVKCIGSCTFELLTANPVINSVSETIASTAADQSLSLTMADFLNKVDVSDPDGSIMALRVQEVREGSLTLDGAAYSDSNRYIYSGTAVSWTPAAGFLGSRPALVIDPVDNNGNFNSSFVANFEVTSTNAVPTLTGFAGVIDSTDEDTEVELSFAELVLQGDEADSDGSVVGFRVSSVESGSLRIGSNSGSATAFDAATNNLIDNDNPAYWTPAADANGTLDAFAVLALDDQGGVSNTANVIARVRVNAINDAPSFSAFDAVLGTTAAGVATTLRFTDLQARSNAVDVDGTVSAYRVKSVASGSLTIYGSPFAVGSNDRIDASKSAEWTPDAAAAGATDAIALTALDDDGAESASAAVTAQIFVQPTLSLSVDTNSLTEAPQTATLTVTLSHASDADVSVDFDFSGTATGSGTDYSASATSVTIPAGQLSRTLTLSTVQDAISEGDETVIVNITVSGGATENGVQQQTITVIDDDNAPPTFSGFAAPIASTDEDSAVEISFAQLAAQGDEADSDGTVTGFVVTSLLSGTLTIDGAAFAVGSNDRITTTLSGSWKPALNAHGTVDAFTVVALDNQGSRSNVAVAARVQVAAINDPPQLDSSAGDQTVTQGVAFSLDVAAKFSDADGDTLTFTASGLPDGLSISAAGVIDGVPSNAAALVGNYTVTVTAADPAGETATDSFDIVVINVNDPPELAQAVVAQTAVIGTAFSLDVSGSFTDPDNDALTFTALGLPLGLSMSAAGILSGSVDATVAAGSFTVTIVATDPDGRDAQTNFTLSVTEQAASDPDASEPPDNRISTTEHHAGSTLLDPIITPEGVLIGGRVGGTVDNQGGVRDVTLLPGARVVGGVVSGVISGDAHSPALLNAHIGPNTELSHVIIGRNASLDASVVLGESVRFESNANVPAGADLSNALPAIATASADDQLRVPDLTRDVLQNSGSGEAAPSLLRSLQLLPEYEPAGVAVEQDPFSGVITITMDELRLSLLPIRVGQAARDQQQGTYVTADGNIRFVTTTLREIISVPAVADRESLADIASGEGMELVLDVLGNLVFRPGDGGSGSAAAVARQLQRQIFYSARPRPDTVALAAGSETGLRVATSAHSEHLQTVYLAYWNEYGEPREQELVPVPVDWPALRRTLASVAGVLSARIGIDGVIQVQTDAGELRAIAAYEVSRNAEGESSGQSAATVSFEAYGDANGDGVFDFIMTYPDGEEQLLYLLPEQAR